MGLEGTWYNELGSEMNLQVEGNSVSGTYQTAVGDAQGIYNLAGTTDTEPYGQSQAVGFTVAWVNKSGNSHSVTAWSGQLQMIDGQEILTATWLLTQETDPGHDWASTLVGMDVFTRNKPSKTESEKRAKLAPWSHPAKSGK